MALAVSERSLEAAIEEFLAETGSPAADFFAAGFFVCLAFEAPISDVWAEAGFVLVVLEFLRVSGEVATSIAALANLSFSD